MIQITTAKGTYLFVEVPNDAYDFRFSVKKQGHLIYRQGEKAADFIQLDKNYEIISTTNQITEEQAESILERIRIKESWKDVMSTVYKNYTSKELIGKYVTQPTESLQSLIKANGLDETKNYIILKPNQ